MTEQKFSKKNISAEAKQGQGSDNTTTEIEAAVFRRLLAHLDANKDAQNIDLMILAGFCRNCLSKWYVSAAADRGLEVEYDKARELVYGMPYSDWKEKHQLEATPEQQQKFDRRHS